MTGLHENIERAAIVAGPSNRAFGVVFAAVFGLIAFWPLFYGGALRWWAAVGCGAFLAAAFVFPRSLAPLNRLWLKFGLALHRVVSPVVLGIMFFLVVTPTGFLMRALGKTPLRLSFDKSTESYWIERRPPGPPPESLRDQF
jgi:hypothetical protein